MQWSSCTHSERDLVQRSYRRNPPAISKGAQPRGPVLRGPVSPLGVPGTRRRRPEDAGGDLRRGAGIRGVRRRHAAIHATERRSRCLVLTLSPLAPALGRSSEISEQASLRATCANCEMGRRPCEVFWDRWRDPDHALIKFPAATGIQPGAGPGRRSQSRCRPVIRRLQTRRAAVVARRTMPT